MHDIVSIHFVDSKYNTTIHVVGVQYTGCCQARRQDFPEGGYISDFRNPPLHACVHVRTHTHRSNVALSHSSHPKCLAQALILLIHPPPFPKASSAILFSNLPSYTGLHIISYQNSMHLILASHTKGSTPISIPSTVLGWYLLTPRNIRNPRSHL